MAVKPMANEADVLAKVAQGDERAFAELFHWYYQPLGKAIVKLTESVALTQEVVQDAFVKIWLNRESLPKIESFSNYLFILCRNHAFATLKRLARERKLQPVLEQQLQWEAELAALDNPSVHYRALIDQAVAKLPEQQRKVYELSRHEGLKYHEIAAKLGISPDTVKLQVYHAVKFIRKELGAHMTTMLIMILTSCLFVN